MARRTNFIDGNDSFRDQNLRFVRNEFEDNVNQFFGGANTSDNAQQAPPRDALIVQPTPDGVQELNIRREFLRDLGSSTAVAHALAMRTLEVPNFDLRHFQRRRYRLSMELGACRQPEVDAVVLQSIGTLVENSEKNRIQSRARPRTPSPPRNINWHNNRDISPQQAERSRPRTRNVDDNIRGRPRGAPLPRENLPSVPTEAGPHPGRRNEVPSPGRHRDDGPPVSRMNVPQGRRNDAPPGRRDVPQDRRNEAPPAPRMNVPQGRRDAVSPGRTDVVAFNPRDNFPPARRSDRIDAVPPANVPQGRRNDAPTGRRDAFPSNPRDQARSNDRSDAVPPVARENVGRKDTVPSGLKNNVPSGRRAPAVPAGPRVALLANPMDSIPPSGKQSAAVGPRTTVPPVGRRQVGPQAPKEVLPPVRGNPGPQMRGKPGPLVRGKLGPTSRVEPVAGRGQPNQGKPPGPLIRGKPGPHDRRNNSQGPAGRVQSVPDREHPVPRQAGPPGRRDNSQGFVERIELTQMSSHERSPPHFDGGRNDSYPNNRPDRFQNNRNDHFEMNNRGMDAEFCVQPDFNDQPRFNHAQRGPGPDDFLVNQRQNIVHDDDEFQRQQQHGFDRPQPPTPFMGNPNTEFFDSEPNFGGQQQQSRNMGGRPHIGNNYQRIFHNDQVTILRTDLVDHNERHFDGNPDNFGPNDRHFEGNFRDQEPRFNDDRDGRQFMDEERFRGQQRADNFGRPQEQPNENWRFYDREPERSDNFDRSLERTDPHNRDVRFNLNNESNHRDLRFNLNNDDRNAYRRDRNERTDQGFIDDNCRDQMMFNDSGPGSYRSNQSRFSGDHRFENDRDFDQQQRQFDGNFNQSNNQREFDTFHDNFQPNQYQDNVDIHYQDRGDQRSLDRGNDRSGSGYRNTNTHNQERNTARNINPSGPRSNQARKAPRNAIAGGPNQNRTNASADRSGNAPRNANQNRTNSSADRVGNAPRNGNQNRTNSSADRAGNAPRNSNPAARAAGPNQNKPNLSTIPAKGGKNTSAASNQTNTAKNPANSGKPAVNQEANTSMQARKMPGKPPEATPRAGQKRGAGDEPQPAVGGEIKRRRCIRGKGFLIGGRKLPYVVCTEKLPQVEEESYAVTFFEQTPNYNTNIYANEDGIVVEDHDGGDDSSGSELELPEITRGGGRYAKKSTQKRLRKKWTALYRQQNYKEWHNWWLDYKWCGPEINKVLEKFSNQNLQHRFLPTYKNSTTEGVVQKVLQLGRLALDKNTFKVQRNMRAIYLLMNNTFLNNLKMENIEQLENLIRRVPNHLWLYKLRSMVFIWEEHHQLLKDTPPNTKKAVLNGYAKKWKTPMFHWLAKQAFDELKAISEISWPDHNRFYPDIKKPLKKQKLSGGVSII